MDSGRIMKELKELTEGVKNVSIQACVKQAKERRKLEVHNQVERFEGSTTQKFVII